MRHLIDTYIQAEEPRKISPFDGIGLLDLIVHSGISAAIADKMAEKLGKKQEAVAEAIENNVRQRIFKEQLKDPAYFDKMSKLLDEIIAARKQAAIEYAEYLKRIEDLVKKVVAGKADGTPKSLDTPGKRALFNNLDKDEEKALAIDQAIHANRPDGWRGVPSKERTIKQAMYMVLKSPEEVERLFPIVVAQAEY
jgi:type I restriction enzyme R subunit